MSMAAVGNLVHTPYLDELMWTVSWFHCQVNDDDDDDDVDDNKYFLSTAEALWCHIKLIGWVGGWQ